MATKRPDWVPEGWEWNDRLARASRLCNSGTVVALERGWEHYRVGCGSTVVCYSLETALAIAELLAAERGGWA